MSDTGPDSIEEFRQIERLVRSVPRWTASALEIRVLGGGITNRNYAVSVAGREFVVRLPGQQTNLLGIDRDNERDAARRAAVLGIGPAVEAELSDIGTLITELVPGRHLDGSEFVERLVDVVAVLRRFHDSGPLNGQFPIHRVIEWHARDAGAHGVDPPVIYAELKRRADQIESAFGEHPLPAVPCHNDLLPGNLLFDDDTQRVWLLDYEYAGMNDRFFDLANLSVNCGLTTDDDAALLELYFGAVTPTHTARLGLMKVMSEFREGMWAVVQQAISRLDTDFVAYADARLANCARLSRDTSFDAMLCDAANPVTA